MSTAKPNLASLARRVAACLIDSLLIFVATLLVLGIIISFPVHPRVAAFSIPIIFACYHAIAVARPRFGFGRTIAAISVVSTKRGADITTRQAIIRATVRAIWWTIGPLLAMVFSFPALALVPVLVDLALITFTPWRQTVADVVAATVVINMPPLRPHAYPALVTYGGNRVEADEPRKPGPDVFPKARPFR